MALKQITISVDLQNEAPEVAAIQELLAIVKGPGAAKLLSTYKNDFTVRTMVNKKLGLK
jgi:hypothetical protein